MRNTVIHLNQETKINQLLGGPMVLNKNEAENFYFKYLCNLCGKYKDFKKLYNDYKENKLKEAIFYNKSKLTLGFNNAINKLKKYYLKKMKKIKKKMMFFYLIIL